MAEKLQVAIVGLGLVGASAGLALRRFQDRVYVIGHDRSPEVAGRAKKMGAVDRTEWNLINTVRAADRVILALPLSEIHDTLEAIAGELKTGCVIVDTADVKKPVMAWAKKLLPDDTYFVGGHPIVVADEATLDGARADLFDQKMFCLTPDLHTNDTAVRLAADVAEALGARPYFLDADEHDGLAAAVQHLPAVTSAALMSLLTTSSGWDDLRKVAGGQFFISTLLSAGSGQEAMDGPFANRELVAAWLDRLIDELITWRDQLLSGEEAAITEQVDRGLVAGRRWLAAQARGNWDDQAPAVDMPTAGSSMREMMFGRLGRAPEKPKRK
jgi:prephenate dehydrogenase